MVTNEHGQRKLNWKQRRQSNKIITHPEQANEKLAEIKSVYLFYVLF